ncbi:MAG: site-specific integrase [Rhodocyclaceae bacterium]|nr:site-specific integrase [Rhodocyclaceae bacterium]
MVKQSAVSTNIENRSPWLVQVRAQPALDKRFSYPDRKAAQAYCDRLRAEGVKPKLGQLETSFQLRVRRKGVKVQHITFDTVHEAEQTRLQIEADLAVSVVRDYAVATQTTLHELMERYLTEVVPQHKGADSETYRLRRLMREEAFVDKVLAAITTEDLQDFILDRLTQVAPATVDRDIDIISQVLHYADDVWRIAASISPLKGLRRPKYFNERDRRLSPQAEQDLLKAAREDENPYIEPSIILAIETAMRRSELLALTFDDIDHERRHALVSKSKNGRPRKVPLSRRALEVIEALPRNESGRLLDLSANALQLGYFRRVLPAAGLEDFHFHDLRHESISRLAESGRFQLIELQAISGHRDMRMLQRYAHLCSGSLAEKMDTLREATVKSYVHRGRKRVVVKAEEPLVETYPVEPAIKLPVRGLLSVSNVIPFPGRRCA